MNKTFFEPTIHWHDDGIRLIDQTRLPGEEVYLQCQNVEELRDAICRLAVRGAPALGVAAAYGMALGSKNFHGDERAAYDERMAQIYDRLATSRPTAVNLFHALNDARKILDDDATSSPQVMTNRLRKFADDLAEADAKVCRQIGQHGQTVIPEGGKVMTVCNAGALATYDYGTALGVMYAAKEAGRDFQVWACETRPLLQGARLTTWELQRAEIPVTLICDNMAATVMRQPGVDVIITGADRIAANGDVANKIGTYALAVLAKHHNVPFYVAAPFSTFDLALSSGDQIPIEERDPYEVRAVRGAETAPKDVNVYNPAFDVTPASLISGIITEQGVIQSPSNEKIQRFFNNRG